MTKTIEKRLTALNGRTAVVFDGAVWFDYFNDLGPKRGWVEDCSGTIDIAAVRERGDW